MSQTASFDLLESPLDGTNLIEAGAGTGKTHTIIGLFLRLVLEKNLSVDEILVVTFTDAATEELKNRIRNMLKDAAEAFARGRSEDVFLNALIKRYKHIKGSLRALREAARDFDRAAIFTIHAFCRRMLQENAFESGSFFDTELIGDQEEIKREIVDDFWRRHFYNASPLFVNYALDRKLGPKTLLSLLSNRVSGPFVKIIPEAPIPDTTKQEESYITAFNTVRNQWKSSSTDIEDILVNDKSLHRNKYRRASIPVWIRRMDRYVVSGGHDPSLFEGFRKFTAGELSNSVKNDHPPPKHPFFEQCETLLQRQQELEEIFDHCLFALKAGLVHYAEKELEKRKAEKNLQYFDDLLLILNRALEYEGGEVLAAAIRRKFGAALIDEFQDTDPVQYAIFKKVFAAKKALFFIGDPKQAIYSFRGADIFAYMKAARDAEFRYTLTENWRSEAGLITAVNAILARAKNPFVYDEIPFQQAVPAAGTDLETLRTDGRSEPHFRLWFLRADTTGAPGKAISKTSAREMIAEAVAAEISRLLIQGRHNRACFGERPLEEGDIAVLVRTNSEARLMQRALSALHVSSVLHSTGNLFDSYEALEMERLMWGIIDPNNESLLKGALATDMIGLYAEQLDVLAADEIGLEEWLVRFQSYNDMWGGRGFIRMFRCFLSEQDVLARLMSLPDGERRCTNIVHLSEVLHQRSVEKKLGMADLLKWLSEQREEDAYRNEEHPQRLESDENAVRLVTIHKSKGLEYPIVFCPFAWAGSRIKESKGPITFHDEDDDMRLTLDLGSPEIQRNLVLAERELLSENLRLLYVALTRAKSRCYLIWGHFKDGETSALSYLFHQPDSWEPKDVVNATKERCSSLSDEDMLRELRTVSEMAMGTIGLSEMPVGPGQEYLHPAGKKETLTCREFGGSIDSQWRVSSFSSLISGFPHGYEMPDRDALGIPEGYDETALEEAEAREPASNFFSFPKGARAGTFVHDIFEHMDFTEKDPAVLKGLVARKLDEYDFEHHWLNSVCDMVRNVLSAHLDTSSTDLSLSCIRSEDRLNELEFYFPLKMVSPEKIEGLLKGLVPTHRAESTDSIHRLYFAPTKGFMKGFMDMVFNWRDRFYLVDWKSNHLGNKVGDYDRASLAVVMKKNLYLLQYSLYTLALDQYLKLRMPDYRYEKHFGGVFYIFVRGVDPETGPDFGIYRDLPSSELIKALRNNLLPDKAW